MNTKSCIGAIGAVLFSMLLIGVLGEAAHAQTAVSSCGTLSSSGNYFLTANLTASGTCLIIGADNIAIDLKGHTITGNGTLFGVTDGGIDRDDVIITNGKITNFNNGINLSNSGDAVVTNVTASSNNNDGIFINGCCNTVSSVTANSNGGNGVEVGEDTNFTNVQANGNTGSGIDATQCCNTVIGSTASNNHQQGINSPSEDSFVIASKAQNNSSDGIHLSECCNGVIITSVSGNGGAGITFPSSDHNMVTESTVSGNTVDGIDFGDRWGIISGVTVKSNGADGVNMLCRGSTASLGSIFNASANLVQVGPPTGDGPCANVDLFAP